MRRLAKNEQRLLILFGAAVFLALNLLAIRLWIQNRSALMAQITRSPTPMEARVKRPVAVETPSTPITMATFAPLLSATSSLDSF